MQKALTFLADTDPRLAWIIPQVELRILTPSNDLYGALLEAIVSQQLSVKAADTIWKRVLTLFGEKIPTPEMLLDSDISTLRLAGLSGQKAQYLGNIAEYWVLHSELQDWKNMSNDILIHELTAIKGVGVWTVQMILIFTLAREDVFAPGDLGIRSAIRDLYGLTEEGKALEKKCIQISENWAPYRSVACRLLWKWRDRRKSVLSHKKTHNFT